MQVIAFSWKIDLNLVFNRVCAQLPTIYRLVSPSMLSVITAEPLGQNESWLKKFCVLLLLNSAHTTCGIRSITEHIIHEVGMNRGIAEFVKNLKTLRKIKPFPSFSISQNGFNVKYWTALFYTTRCNLPKRSTKRGINRYEKKVEKVGHRMKS